MGLPAKQRTRRSKKERSSHFALKKTMTAKCEECKADILPHRACPKCGRYKGRKAKNTEKRVLRRKRNKTKLDK